MYKYRVIESPANKAEIIHTEEFSEERDAMNFAFGIVQRNHTNCYLERFNGEKWERGNRKYFWYFERVCHYNY